MIAPLLWVTCWALHKSSLVIMQHLELSCTILCSHSSLLCSFCWVLKYRWSDRQHWLSGQPDINISFHGWAVHACEIILKYLECSFCVLSYISSECLCGRSWCSPAEHISPAMWHPSVERATWKRRRHPLLCMHWFFLEKRKLNIFPAMSSSEGELNRPWIVSASCYNFSGPQVVTAPLCPLGSS